MSGQQTFIKIGAACAVIVLASVFAGSQLSTGGNFESFFSKPTEEDEAGVIESGDADDAEAREEDEDSAEAEEVSESEADEDAAEEEVASDDSESDEADDVDQVATDEEPAGSENDEADEVDEVATDEEPAGSESGDDDGDRQQADAGSSGDQDGDVIYNGLPVEPGSDE